MELQAFLQSMSRDERRLYEMEMMRQENLRIFQQSINAQAQVKMNM